ncbi:HlyD family secretion protein [Pontibacter sp. E15-1]|uniref:HlyD family secretion protein n=1 Tax=Pontibacter sp. E15-1 TaxID=2919918 RepID=UPI001F4F6B5F|nr:HlyD family secretion protein [Pontibacter sp. E15-1]MCJ8165991.1 HlyD family secretion protein [Pontibacter sp. E15-1]
MQRNMQNTEKQVEVSTKTAHETAQGKHSKHASKKKDRKLNRIKTTVINLVVLTVAAGGFYWLIQNYFHLNEDNFTNSAQVEEFINPVNTRVSGYIKEIQYNEHQGVKKGDTLVVLDDRELRTQVAQAEAAYQNALAAREVTLSSINTVSNNINVAEANISGAKARLWNAEQNLKRYKNLLADEAVTRQQYDQVKTEYDATKAAYETLVSQKHSATFATSETKSRLSVNDAEIKRTAAMLEMAKINLSYAVITAPYDGIMGRRLINEGQLVQPGQQLGTIVLDGQKWITANFLENQMSKVKLGKKMNITVDALNGQQFTGVVTAISAATGAKYSNIPVDNSSGNFVKVQQRIPVRIEFDSDTKQEDLQQLRAGMNVSVTLKSTK